MDTSKNNKFKTNKKENQWEKLDKLQFTVKAV